MRTSIGSTRDNLPETGLRWFPHAYAATGQVGKIVGNAQAADSFCVAVEAAEESGLLKRSDPARAYQLT
jgi:hypothetical protein